MPGKLNELSSLRDHTLTKWLRKSLSVSVVAVGCMTIAPPAVARTPFDGDWSVMITTRGGACQPSVRYGVQIINGMVVNPAGGPGQVSGRVAPNGVVRVSVQAGGQSASGSGRLSSSRGGGVWRGQGSAGFCQGTWVAERRAGYGAEAQASGGPIYNYAPQTHRYGARNYRYARPY
jgi:hypothetical protein